MAKLPKVGQPPEPTVEQLKELKYNLAKARDYEALYRVVAANNDRLKAKLIETERDLQRVSLAFESIRTTVHLTSAQLNLEGINPTVTFSLTSLVKNNQA